MNEVASKQCVYKEGDFHGNRFYVIEEGKIEARLENQYILTLKEGDLFGVEELLCRSQERLFSVIVLGENTRIWEIDLELLQG